MIETLRQFQNRIEQIRSFLKDSEAINALAEITDNDVIESGSDSYVLAHVIQLRTSKLNRRLQVYTSGVIMLYGMLEQYLEDILIDYLEELDLLIDKFNDMPDKIKANHTILSAQLLINRKYDKYRDSCIESEVVRRMYLCLGDGEFKINSLAFIDHRSNFRIDTLNDLFEQAGVGGMSSLIKNTVPFIEYSSRRFPELNISVSADNVVFEDLNDLAWRRNVVAHGWADDTLSIDLMRERVDFVSILGESIYTALKQKTYPYAVKHKCHSLPDPIAVYGNSIVCFHLENETISKNSKIIVFRQDGTYQEAKIERIEVNKVEEQEVIAPPSVDMACKLDIKIKPNCSFFIFDR